MSGTDLGPAPAYDRAMHWNAALGALAASWGFIAGLVASVDLGAGLLPSGLASATPPLIVAFWDCLVGAIAVSPVLLVAGRVAPSGVVERAVALTPGIVFTGLPTLVHATLSAGSPPRRQAS